MRSTFLHPFLFALLSIPSGSHAQWSIGPKAGLSLARMHDVGDHRSLDSKMGFVGGISVQTSTRTFRLQPELLFVQKGYQADEQLGYTGLYEAEWKFTINYLELPIMATAALGNGKAKLLLQAGPYIAAVLGVKSWEKVTHDGESYEDTSSGSADDFNLNGVDLGLNVGAGMAVPVGGSLLTIEARYQWGITDISDAPNLDHFDRCSTLTVGYLLPMKGHVPGPVNTPTN